MLHFNPELCWPPVLSCADSLEERLAMTIQSHCHGLMFLEVKENVGKIFICNVKEKNAQILSISWVQIKILHVWDMSEQNSLF